MVLLAAVEKCMDQAAFAEIRSQLVRSVMAVAFVAVVLVVILVMAVTFAAVVTTGKAGR